jgi:hypothetical protein
MDARLEELRRQLNQKTTEIESLLAAERGMGSVEDILRLLSTPMVA